MTGTDYIVPRGRCSNCDSHFAEDDTFEYRGFHFCTECVSELASWFLDGGIVENPEQFGWVLGEPDEGAS